MRLPTIARQILNRLRTAARSSIWLATLAARRLEAPRLPAMMPVWPMMAPLSPKTLQPHPRMWPLMWPWMPTGQPRTLLSTRRFTCGQRLAPGLGSSPAGCERGRGRKEVDRIEAARARISSRRIASRWWPRAGQPRKSPDPGPLLQGRSPWPGWPTAAPGCATLVAATSESHGRWRRSGVGFSPAVVPWRPVRCADAHVR